MYPENLPRNVTPNILRLFHRSKNNHESCMLGHAFRLDRAKCTYYLFRALKHQTIEVRLEFESAVHGISPEVRAPG